MACRRCRGRGRWRSCGRRPGVEAVDDVALRCVEGWLGKVQTLPNNPSNSALRFEPVARAAAAACRSRQKIGSAVAQKRLGAGAMATLLGVPSTAQES
jgi:hypothetical protein